MPDRCSKKEQLITLKWVLVVNASSLIHENKCGRMASGMSVAQAQVEECFCMAHSRHVLTNVAVSKV